METLETKTEPFKVLSSTEKINKPGQFITKIRRIVVIKDPYIGLKELTTTYYIAGTQKVTVDVIPSQHIEDNFRVQEYQMANPSTGELFMGKWLHAKQA